MDAIGQVSLEGVQFSTDPQIYEPLNWDKRHSVHPGISGSLTIQDFGMIQKDNTLRLASGTAGYLDHTTVKALHVLYRTKGVTHTLSDWIGNEFEVFILSFAPVPTFVGSGEEVLYTYTMELHVLDITMLLGDAFFEAE